MFSTTRARLVVLATLLSLTSVHAFAVETSTDFKASGCSVPEYRMDATKADEQGLVKLAFNVTAEGKVVDVKVEKSSGFHALDNASLRAVKECSFKVAPVAKDGKMAAKIAFDWVLN